MTDICGYNRLVRHCRAKHFIFTLAAKIHVAPNGPALARWWEATHGPTEDTQLNRKWDAYFQGALPSSDLLKLLLNELPEMLNGLTSPIWYALSDIQTNQSKAFWNSCANAVRIQNAPIGYYSQRHMREVRAYPNLDSLGVFVLLLRGDAPQYRYHRLGIAKFFTRYLCIALVDSVLKNIARDIYQLTDMLIRTGQFGDIALQCWPENADAFNQLVERYAQLGRRLSAIIGIERPQSDLLLLLWLVTDDWQLLSQFRERQGAASIPDSFRRKWARQCQRFACPSTQLLTAECETRVLAPPEQRVWNRLLL
ncbi:MULTISPECIES: hypothetical protein [unclassified Pseudomonas]|uniref:hypothetical protein n=1 Tax=unclassified Pseudomonas TaxID=196821 RepID=UPI00117BCC6F|nr:MULTISPECIES: hypothetical protein [unclassified Pseudomonas]